MTVQLEEIPEKLNDQEDNFANESRENSFGSDKQIEPRESFTKKPSLNIDTAAIE